MRCAHCDRQLVQVVSSRPGGRKKVYCSANCRSNAYRHRLAREQEILLSKSPGKDDITVRMTHAYHSDLCRGVSDEAVVVIRALRAELHQATLHNVRLRRERNNAALDTR